MKISLGSWAFSFGPYASDPIPFETIVRRLSAAGYDGVDICGFPPHVTLDSHPPGKARASLVRMLGDLGLGVSGYAADFYLNPAAPENRVEYLDQLKRNVEMCADIGSPSLRVDTVAAPGSISDEEYAAAFQRIAGLWREGAEFAGQADVRLVWEFEPGFAFNKPNEIFGMHRAVLHPNFRVLFDTAHAFMCGVSGVRQHGPRDVMPGVAEFLEALGNRVGGIHLTDSDATLHNDETSTHRPLGTGLIDFDALAPKLVEVRDVDWWTIDMSFWPGSWDLIDSSLAFVKGLIARHKL